MRAWFSINTVKLLGQILLIKEYINVNRGDQIMPYQAERTRENTQSLLAYSGKTAWNSLENRLNFILEISLL
jgi:hypothetical protein